MNINSCPDDGSLLGFETLTEIMVFTVGSPVSNKEDHVLFPFWVADL